MPLMVVKKTEFTW